MIAQQSHVHIQFGVYKPPTCGRPLISLWKKTYMVEEGQQAILSCRVKVSLNFSYLKDRVKKLCERNLVQYWLEEILLKIVAKKMSRQLYNLFLLKLLTPRLLIIVKPEAALKKNSTDLMLIKALPFL
jgi:hypothetical protein